MRKILLSFLVVSVGLASCKKETEDLSEIAQGNKFYPTEIGKYIVYDYDSTYWNDQLKAEIHHQGQVRYYTTDTFIDGSGRIAYVVNVQSRRNDTDPYVANDVIYATPAENHVELYQKGLSFIKMVFPVSDGKTWNGNAMINMANPLNAEFAGDAWKYTYDKFNTEFDPGNNLYEHTVTVNQIDDALNNPDVDSTVYAYRNYSQEVYAYNVGMVYRERIYWVFQPKVGSSGGSGYRKGYAVIMKAVENN